ncbi:unnamed protein product [Brassica oleracea var. botrytis]
MTPLSSLLMGKHHTGLQLAPETELALLSDQAVHLVEGLELDKLNEKFLPIKDTHQVGYVQEATTHNVFFCFLCIYLDLHLCYHTPFNKIESIIFFMFGSGLTSQDTKRVQNYVLISSLRNRKVLICHSVLIRLIIWTSFGNFKKGQI